MCPLCSGEARPYFRELFLQCTVCQGIIRSKTHLPTPEEERARYEEHHNDVNNPGYQAFVKPITDRVLQEQDKLSLGLDFGSGTGPVISKLLTDRGYKINQFDPFFDNNPDVLKLTYNYVACCEVIEHFHAPDKEFRLLHSLLKPGGRLYCMTHLFSDDITFDNWYYMRDPTHTFIYQADTLTWIKDNVPFSELEIVGRLIVLTK